jgi:transcriptional regulator with XRE-family HTH domain
MAHTSPDPAPPPAAVPARGPTGLGQRLAAYRTARGLKVTQLARAIGVSSSLISQIERQQSQPSVSTLFALAEALDVPVDAFFEEGHLGATTSAALESDEGQLADEASAGQYVVRRGGRPTIEIEGGVRWERLTPQPLDGMEFLEIVYQPRAESHAQLYRHPGSEMVLVLSGTLDIFIGFRRHRLAAGDSIHFPSSLPHRYVNPTAEETRAVTVLLHELS